MRGALAPQYEVERELASGGMGTVLLARDTVLDRKVAIKVLRPELDTPGAAKRLLREARILARLNHLNIVPVYSAGEAAGCFYYVMDYVEGETLADRLRRGPLPLDEAVKLGIDLLDALEAAHEQGVIHRDVKPGNVFLVKNRALLGDFGIAKETESKSKEMTAPGYRVGTPGYMAPEQAAGQALTPHTDLYALGLLLHEALTGRKWAALATTAEMDLSGLPPALAPVLWRALEWSPKDRWTDAAAFRRALLQAAGESEAGRESPAGLRGFLSKLKKRRVSAAPPATPTPTPSGAPDAVAVESIAVLPFADLSPERDQEYFSDGIAEELLNRLAKIKGLRVAARTSSFQFKGQTGDVREVGEKLGVETVMEGSVRKSQDRLRITAQLVSTRDGFHLWAETYDRQLADVFAVQEEIAKAIVGALEIRLPGGRTPPIAKERTPDVEAHNLYLKGRHLWNRRTKAGLEQAVEYFRQATDRDPLYAPAYAGLADAYLLHGSYRFMPRAEAHRRAKAAAEKALELDETLAEAHTSRGQVLRSERDWRGEEQEYLRAIELNPSYATAHQWYATLLAALGRTGEALREIRHAEELDPLSHAISVTVGVVLLNARDYDGAIEQLKKTLELAPDFFSAHRVLGAAYSEKGEHQEAIQEINRAIELNPEQPDLLANLAYNYAKSGQREKALELLGQAKQRGADPSFIAIAYSALGQPDLAFEWLERAVEEGQSPFLFFLKVGPWYDPLRSDPRFQDLLRRMNSPE